MRWTTVLCASALALTACGSETESNAEEDGISSGPARDGQYLLAEELNYLADPARDSLITIQASDFERVAEILGEDKPSGSEPNADELLAWASAASLPADDGSPALATIFPSSLGWDQYIANTEVIDDTLGVSPWNVTRFAEVVAPPTGSTVIQGDYDTDRITAALGDPGDGVWSIGEELAQNFEQSEALPPLGAGLRLAEADDRLLLFREEQPLRGVISGNGSLADDDQISALATALDHAGWYSAMIIANHDFSIALPVDLNPDAYDFDDSLLLDPFLALGAAVDVVDDEHVVHVAYVHDDAAGAESNADRIVALVDEGVMFTGRKVSDLFTIVDTQVDDTVLTVSFSLTDTAPGAIWAMIGQREALMTHR